MYVEDQCRRQHLFNSPQQPHIAEDEEDGEEDEVTGHTHHG